MLFQIGPWMDILKFLLVSEDVAIVQRGACIVRNLMATSEEIARKVIESDIMELLMAISKLPDKLEAQSYCNEALDKAVEWNLIQPVAKS